MDELATKKQPVSLSNATLGDLPPKVLVPTYERSALTHGIVHIGVGNFHRAHQAWYLHRLMQQGEAQDWAIMGAGVRPYDAAMREKLLAQDCLYTLIELAPERAQVEVVGSIVDYVPIAADNAPLIAAMSDPAVRIVELTVTEGGYYLDPATGAFDEAHGDIVHDAAHPETPKTAFGAIVKALQLRRLAGDGAFTVLSCDNLKGNGAIAQQTVVGLARMIDSDLAEWIEASCTFPNSMVDSIVPATGPGVLKLAGDLGIDDAVPVTHENFRQWVIEDRFCAGRPDWDRVGATFAEDVHGYEAMKLRILNAGHQFLANAGELMGLATIDACINDEVLSAFFAKVQISEVLPHVDGVPGVTPSDYLVQVTKRFKNPAVKDTTRRVAFDGSSRHTGFILPIVRDALASDAPIEGLALAEALWARMCAGVREDGSAIEPNDPQWDSLNSAALATKTDPAHWLAQREIYGDLGSDPRFTKAFAASLEAIWRDGVASVLRAYAQES